MKYVQDKDFNKEIQSLVQKGWMFDKGKKHGKLASPWGDVLTISTSPGDRRNIIKFRSDVKRVERQAMER